MEPSDVSVEVIESTSTPTTGSSIAIEATPEIPPDAEPVIFTSLSIEQKCGHGDIVAFDGHSLHATPRLLANDSNFLAHLPEGSQVHLIDCRLWTDQEGLSWLAVRTVEKKLGWMLVQPDKLYVTIYPIVSEPPLATTGMPAVGEAVAYVPPSDCQERSHSDEAVATSIGVDLIPVVGDLKGVGEAATGCDMVTGESLGHWRWFGLLGLIGLSEVAVLRHGDEAGDAARVVDNLDGSLYADDAILSAARNADTASDFARQLDELGYASDAGGALRTLDNGGGLSDEAVRALAELEQPCSFSGDTVVSTLRGLVPISDVEVGDLVRGYDESAAVTGFYTVTATFAHLDRTVVALTLGHDSLETTPEHPFHVEDQWVAAGDLREGDVVSSVQGKTGVVQRIRRFYRPQIMYNLTVAEAHTYAVGSGNWLVHNACARLLRGALGEPEWADGTAWQAHHVIPGEMEREHRFAMRAIAGGWNIDSPRNGIALPALEAEGVRLGLPVHRGSHPQYSQRVRAELDRLEDAANSQGWDNARAVQEMERLADRMRRYILNQPAGQRLR
jgi:hypothetical protein